MNVYRTDMYRNECGKIVLLHYYTRTAESFNNLFIIQYLLLVILSHFYNYTLYAECFLMEEIQRNMLYEKVGLPEYLTAYVMLSSSTKPLLLLFDSEKRLLLRLRLWAAKKESRKKE